VDFRNTVIIMTSNIGAKSLLKDTTLGFRPTATSEELERDRQYDRMKDKVMEQLKTQFRPEFLNRVDSFVVFRSLSVEEIRQIVDLLLHRVREQLRAQQISLEITQAAKDHIIEQGYDADFGARPLKRVIQSSVEDPLAEALLLGRYGPGQTVVVDRDLDGGLTIAPLEEKTPVEA
jgi:ATP-dependent Clp protease ATP-binding subunit ClpC